MDAIEFRCAMKGCKSLKMAKDGPLFHEFPVANSKLMQKWIDAVGRVDWTPSEGSYICSVHFNPRDYIYSDKGKRLKVNATPILKARSAVADGAEEVKKPAKKRKATGRKLLEIKKRKMEVKAYLASMRQKLVKRDMTTAELVNLLNMIEAERGIVCQHSDEFYHLLRFDRELQSESEEGH